MKRAFIRYGQFLFRYRRTVFATVVIVLVIVLPPRLAFGSTAVDVWFDVLGVLVVVTGLTLRGLVIGLQYIVRAGKNGRVYANELVTGGIFSASRNPLYVGNFLLLLGVLIISGNPWALIIGIALALSAYHAIVAAEEEFLLDKFGDQYRDYCASVNRWLPSPSRVKRALDESRFNWPRVVIKDYNTVFVWLTAALAMLAYEHLSLLAYRQNWADQVPLGVIFIGLVVMYLVARVLKKKRLLTEDGWRTRSATSNQ